jgi:sec-independent protein translocase protein TatB
MDIFGIGPFEFLAALIIALLVLGPERMVSASRAVARFIRNALTSPTWRTMQDVQREIQTLPTTLIRETGLEDIEKALPTPAEIIKDSGLEQLQKEATTLQAEALKPISSAPTIQAPPPKKVALPETSPEPTIAPAASPSAPTVTPAAPKTP